MPSHGPTEPPDESHGWEDEYDRIMETPAAVAMLRGLCRLVGYDPLQTVLALLEPEDIVDVETDDDALQAFVREVYDRGLAHGVGLVRDEQAHAALAAELEEQDAVLGVVTSFKPTDRKLNPIFEIGSSDSPFKALAGRSGAAGECVICTADVGACGHTSGEDQG